MAHTTDPHHDALMAVSRSLDDGEAVELMHAAVAANPRLAGARVADVLDLMDSHDAYLDRIEPFYEDNAGELPQVTGTRFALYALILLGRELTPANVIKVLTAAGLMPQRKQELTWQAYSTPPMRAVAGYQADGAELHYLVFRHLQGNAHVLIRYPRNGTFTETVISAASYAATLTTPDEGRRLAELFEAGQDIPEIGWYHGRPPEGMRTT